MTTFFFGIHTSIILLSCCINVLYASSVVECSRQFQSICCNLFIIAEIPSAVIGLDSKASAFPALRFCFYKIKTEDRQVIRHI